MNYERTGKLTHDDIAALLADVEKQMEQNDWRMLPPDSIHGFLTAIAIGPKVIMPSVWLPRIFFSRNELPKFNDAKQAEKIVYVLLKIYNGVLKMIQEGIFSPFITIIEKGSNEEEDLSLWCKGFLLGMSVFDEHEWNVFTDKDLAEICLPIYYNSRSDSISILYSDEQVNRMKECADESGNLIIDAVYNIQDYFRDSPQSSPQSVPKRKSASKISRNEPCPCGSGKKFKKCCGEKE